MIRILYFVRHGHYKTSTRKKSDTTEKDGHLTLMGLEDIVEVAHKLKKVDKKINHVYSSPYMRTRETADLIAKILNRYTVVREYLHEGHTLNNTVDHYKQLYFEFEKVVTEALNNNDGPSVIVSHDLPISLFLSIKSGISFEEITQNYNHLDLLQESDCVKATFNELNLVKYEKI